MTAVLQVHGRGRTALCRPVSSGVLGSPPAGPYRGPGRLRTLVSLLHSAVRGYLPMEILISLIPATKLHTQEMLLPMSRCFDVSLSTAMKLSRKYMQCSQASRPSRVSVSSCRARASVLWERLPSKRVTVGPYSPLRIGNSRTVHAVLTRHPQSSPVLCSPRLLPVGPARHPELPGKLRHLRHL